MSGLSPAAVELLAEVARNAASEFEPAVRGYLKLLAKLTEMESTMLLVIDYDSDPLQQRAQYVEVDDGNVIPIVEGDEFLWMTGGCRLLRASGRNFSSDMQADYPEFELSRAIGLRAYLSVPIEIGPDRRLVGTLCGMHPQPWQLTEDAIAIARVLAQLIAVRYDREAQLAAERARTLQAGERLHTWVELVIDHEERLRTDLTVIAGLVNVASQAGESADVPNLLRSASQRLAVLEAEVAAFLGEARHGIQVAAQQDLVNLLDVVAEFRETRLVAVEGLVPGETYGHAPGEIWVNAQPSAIRSLLRLLLGRDVGLAGVPTLAVQEGLRSVLITATGNSRGVSLSVLRALVAGLGGALTWQSLPDGRGRLEVSLPTVPAPVRL